jgi:Rps23 Pro-64 3,4-dihydroxylase Tpa1-like proline 4-hydroxylase
MIVYIENLITTELSNKIVSEMNGRLCNSNRRASDSSPLSFSENDDYHLSKLLISGIGENIEIFSKIANLLDCHTEIEINEYMPHFFVYEEGNFIGAHSDIFYETTANCISVVFYFNDNYSDGELVIYDKICDTTPGKPRGPITEEQHKVAKFKAKAGSVVVFPHTIMHEALAVNSGRKYICTMMYKIG